MMVSGASSEVVRADEVDEQVWTETNISLPLDEKRNWNLSLTTILRASQDASRLTDRRLGLGLTRRLNRHSTLGGAVQFRRNGPSFGNSTRETRFTANATFQTPLGARISLVNRNLLERRDNFPGRDTTIYRNRTQINFPTQVFKTAVTPFVAGEFFYDFRLKEWARTRASVGITRRFNKRVTADVYFLRQIEGGGGRPGDLHVFGVNLRLSP